MIVPGSAKHLLGEALIWARAQWPEAVLIPELSVGSWGSARLDLAVVLTDQLIGVEIKGDGDSTARLSLQGMLYSAVCSRMFLLCSDKLRKSCVSAKPPGWFMVKDSEGGWWKEWEEEHQTGHGYDGKAMPTSPARLVSMLWTAEVKMAIDIHGVFVPQKHSLALALAEEVPLKLLRPTVYWLLHRRKWESARFGAKLIYRPANVSAA